MRGRRKEDAAFLTPGEHQLIESLGKTCMSICSLAGTTEGDRAEAILHTHALQNMVLARAAARAYPGRYRL